MRGSYTLTISAVLFGTALFAQNTPQRGTTDPYDYHDGSWIGVAGQVESTAPGSFVLNYGDGTIKVELEPSSTKSHDFIKDEHVRVFGVVDDGLFKARTIKADAVYVDSMKDYVCTTSGAAATCASFAPVILSGIVVHGLVTSVGANTIQLDRGDREIQVDTSELENSAGDTGAGKDVQVGDLVTVLGHMDDGLFSRKLKASSVEVDQ